MKKEYKGKKHVDAIAMASNWTDQSSPRIVNKIASHKYYEAIPTTTTTPICIVRDQTYGIKHSESDHTTTPLPRQGHDRM